MYNTETAAVDGTAACARFAPSPSARRDMADATLIARIATGDRLAMHALFARHKTRVYRFILRLVGDAASADDLTSEVFLTVWRHAHKFRGRAAASTWLLAIARFKALDELRRRRDAAPDLEQPDASDPAADPEASWADKHRGAMLRKCLGALSPEHRTIIDLVYYHEKSVQEVAAIVGIPCATVKTRMFYARKKLAALLAAERAGEAETEMLWGHSQEGAFVGSSFVKTSSSPLIHVKAPPGSSLDIGFSLRRKLSSARRGEQCEV